MKLRRELTSQRELVRKLQLQSIFRNSDRRDYDLTAAAFLDKDFQKRSAERDVTFPSLSREESFDQFFDMQERSQESSKQQKRSTEENNLQQDISSEEKSKITVPFVDRSSKDANARAPCRQKRSLEDKDGMAREKRHLKTPPGQGLVPQYNMYDELCEDNQPVKVVKIKSLVIKDGVIRENDISEA